MFILFSKQILMFQHDHGQASLIYTLEIIIWGRI